MEILLNFAWAACSVGMIWFWIRTRASNPVTSGPDTARPVPRRTQMLALAMVVLLLLPVISLSDDLMAMQGLAETDSSARRANHLAEGHPPVAPTSFALPEQTFEALPGSGYAQVSVQKGRLSPPPPALTRSLDRRPPPLA
jgi:hypothetical protein